MKKIITIIAILTFTLGCAQVWPITHISTLKVPQGTHVKDIDGLFIPYIGTWQGTWNGKLFILKIENYPDRLNSFPSGYYYYEDELIAKYKVIQTDTGSIIESTMDVSDLEVAKLESLGYPKDNEFDFLYSDIDKCGNTGKFMLEGNPATNQLQYFYYYEGFWISKDCPYTSKDDIPINLPTGTMTLTRIQ